MELSIEKKSSPLWQFLIYFVMLCFTFISTPKTGMTHLISRAIQLIEVIFFATLIIKNYKQGLRVYGFNSGVNLWWLFYTILAYLFSSSMGLTPCFQWMNVMIFLLLGTCYWQHNYIESLKYIATVFSFLIYLNTILLLLFPDGLWIDTEWVGRGNPTRYLFGNYNQIGFVSLLGITTQAMYTFYSGKGRLNLYIILLLSIGSVVFVGSMTSFIGLSIFAAYILLHKHIRHPRIYVWIFTIVYLLFFFFIVWYGNSIEEIKWAAQFIEQQLSKDTTFTFRTLIWENAVYMIQKSPWIGHGIQSVEWNDVYLEASGPHNLWLMLLLQGGRILCISFITIVVYIVHKALKTRTMTSILGVVSLCVLFIMSMFETYFIAQIFLLLQFVYYATFTPNPDTITEDANNPQITKI